MALGDRVPAALTALMVDLVGTGGEVVASLLDLVLAVVAYPELILPVLRGLDGLASIVPALDLPWLDPVLQVGTVALLVVSLAQWSRRILNRVQND